MKISFHELVNKYGIPQAFLGKLCGFNRSAVNNWMHPERYPIPEKKKVLIQKKLRELGKILIDIELK